MNKYGVYNEDGKINIVFQTESEAIRHAMLCESDHVKLIPNRWWIDSDWSDEDGNFIIEERNPDVAEFNQLIENSGITIAKLAQIAGVAQSTIYRWKNGQNPIPPLVLDKLRQISAAVNGK
jgi:DNA-binding XRE family transcriptional regulator